MTSLPLTHTNSSVRIRLSLLSSLLCALWLVSCKNDTVEQPPPEPEPTYYPPPEGNTTPPPPQGNTTPPPPQGNTTPPPPQGNTTPPQGGGLTPVGGEEGGEESVGGEEYYGGEEYNGGYEEGGELTPSCTPGEVLGLCEVCGEDGYPTYPDTDVNCEPALCPSEIYELDIDGACFLREQGSPDEGYCLDIGECFLPEEQPCDVLSETLIAEDGVCSTIISCEGTEPPELDERPNGALCNTWGTCQAGACNAPSFCEVFVPYNTQNFLCQAGQTDNGESGCVFFVNGTGIDNSGQTTCNDFCANSGTTCIDGWNDNNGTCNRGNGGDGCDQTYSTQVCVCELPPAP